MPAGFRLTCAVALSTVIALPAMARDTSRSTTAPAPSAAMHGDAKRPAQASHWQRAELYFGLGRTGGADAADYAQRWQAFLDEDVTPRFPDGFSVLDVQGQWKKRDTGTIERLNSKLVVILFHGTRQRRALDALRTAWKQRTGDESVLLSITPAQVSF
ncbi:DUF3574 domain-containing protein [Nevskia sp.]|uniref:DUF3574 domain-containing protein n=1 Tax=Nevskia sp. TaxID=1929292 RepID=UPI0025EC365D|nr:DUF3574 domain-containing protein [Nevskia sp.]